MKVGWKRKHLGEILHREKDGERYVTHSLSKSKARAERQCKVEKVIHLLNQRVGKGQGKVVVAGESGESCLERSLRPKRCTSIISSS